MPANKKEDIIAYLEPYAEIFSGRLSFRADMRKITWFRTGGSAAALFQPKDEEDLQNFLKVLPEEIPLVMVGIGSNILVRDGGIEGVVLRLPTQAFGEVNWLSDTQIEVGCALSDKKLAQLTAQKGIGGFHFFYGIPGNIGGALRMNAGANGVETCERVVKVRAMDRAGNIKNLSLADMGYNYRHSDAPRDLIFLSAILEGYKSDPALIATKMEEVKRHREEVQPVREKTGGSTFRNPEGISAWQAIDQAGCRGLAINDAQMSEMHCNFMINKGNATAYDLELLGETVRKRVYAHSGVALSWEIARLGVFEEGRIVEAFSVPSV